ncbi:MAG TPA: ATP-binding cassette domain-containing protein [Chitinispirillaceae bacterium]|nr:ATP-binding cassette domain-containing protein [Chitinispirillaceae bacterium]
MLYSTQFMAILNISNISIAFGGPSILDSISFGIEKGQRICILGRNGTGKSTLLKVIAGELVPDSGTIIKDPGLHIAYLSQDVPDNFSGTVADIITAGAGKSGEMLVRWNMLQAQHSESDELPNLQHALDSSNGWQIQTITQRLLTQMQLDGSQNFSTLSGGMRRRVMLARALVTEPDLLLLDEPTNHLDITSIQWIESFILGSNITLLFVTHDRKLLKRLATRIVELDRGKLYDWACDYTTFLERKRSVLDAEEREWERFDKRLAQEEVWIRKGVKARRTRNEGRVRALIQMRNERRKRRERTGTVSMTISESGRSGDRVIETKNLSYTWETTPIVSSLTFTVMRGDKIGIMGPNGCGKTTLLKLLLGKLQPSSGAIQFGTNLVPIYFDQLRETLDPEKTIWENVAPGGDTVSINDKPQHIISYLQDFLFTADRAKTPVKYLSGGERNRLVLASMFTQPSNILILDEPTNDLDIETLELLEEILSSYSGTVLIVSHDREFLNNLVTSTLVFEDGAHIKEYIGGYDDWEKQKQELENNSEKLKEKTIAVKEAKPDNPNPKKLSYKEKQLLESLPQKIEQLETEQAELNNRLADPVYFKKPGFVAETKGRLSLIETELENSYHLWQDLESRN